MNRDSGYAQSPPVSPTKLVWSYGGYQYDPSRRVSVSPNVMLLNTQGVTLEARGVLLTLFCRYWMRDEGIEAEHLRREHRLSKRKFHTLIDELIGYQLVRLDGGRLFPTAAFGPDPEASPPRGAVQNKREQPAEWLAIRDEVFARDHFACVYCGSGRDLHCDHVHPVALGGGHEIENLVTACASCNLSKGSKTVAQWRPDLAEVWKR